jgi:hypothetical protein
VTQFNSPTTNTPAPQEKPTRFSLAFIAFVFSILSPVPCCLFVGFISTPLSILALWKLRNSNDVRSRQLARAAIVLSFVGLIVQALTYQALSEWVLKDIGRNMKASMQAAFANEYSKCVIALTQNPLVPVARPAPTAEQLQVFSSLVKQRYGELRDISIISQVVDGGMFDMAMTAAITLRFATRETTGSAVFQVIPQSDQWIPAARLLELTVDDSTLGDLILAPSSLPAPTPATTIPALP